MDQVNLQWHERPHQENYLELNPVAGYDLIKLKAEKREEQYLAGGKNKLFQSFLQCLVKAFSPLSTIVIRL